MVTKADSPVADYPGGIPAIKKARNLFSFTPTKGALIGTLPLLALAGIGLRRRKTT
jgi:MYXO-CTERM domain-containing protein